MVLIGLVLYCNEAGEESGKVGCFTQSRGFESSPCPGCVEFACSRRFLQLVWCPLSTIMGIYPIMNWHPTQGEFQPCAPDQNNWLEDYFGAYFVLYDMTWVSFIGTAAYVFLPPSCTRNVFNNEVVALADVFLLFKASFWVASFLHPTSAFLDHLSPCPFPSLRPWILQSLPWEHQVLQVSSAQFQPRWGLVSLSLWEGILQGPQRPPQHGLYP